MSDLREMLESPKIPLKTMTKGIKIVAKHLVVRELTCYTISTVDEEIT